MQSIFTIARRVPANGACARALAASGLKPAWRSNSLQGIAAAAPHWSAGPASWSVREDVYKVLGLPPSTSSESVECTHEQVAMELFPEFALDRVEAEHMHD